jgi:hypothetical protein
VQTNRGRVLRGAAAAVLLAVVCQHAVSSDQLVGLKPALTKHADFGRERSTRQVRRFADWIVDSGDHNELPFVIIDKVDARIYVFSASGRIRGAAATLLGSAIGDYSVPGIGERELSDMGPEDRTTPAGRFVAAIGRNTRGEDVVWVDYDSGLSLHRVLTTKPEERRLERLATPTPKDNRISYGCINVPKKFYETIVAPTFAGTDGIVYILPEVGSVRTVFGNYRVEEPKLQPASHSIPVGKPSQVTP